MTQTHKRSRHTVVARELQLSVFKRAIDEMQFFKLPLWEVKLKEKKNE